MKTWTSTLILGALLAPSVFAAEEQCFEFTRSSTEFEGVAPRPAIVTKRFTRADGSVVIISQELVPLNEETQDTLASLQVGQQVCLKGTRGYGSYPKFFAYSARQSD